MRVRSGYRTVLAVLGAAGLMYMQSVQAQQVSTPANEQVEQVASKEAQDSSPQAAVGSTITVRAGFFPALPVAPSFCVFSDCSKPTIELVVDYQDAPELSKALKAELQEKYFYIKGDAENPEASRKHLIAIKTIYLGDTDGYKEILARNNIEEAERTAKNKSSAVVDLVTLILSRGNVRTNSGYNQAQTISNSEVANLPAGPKKILVTQITLSVNGGGPRNFLISTNEALSAAYEDMDEAQLRRENLEAGLRRIVGVAKAGAVVKQ